MGFGTEKARARTAAPYRHDILERTVSENRDAPGRLAGQPTRDRTRVRVPATDAWTAKTGMANRPRGLGRPPWWARETIIVIGRVSM